MRNQRRWLDKTRRAIESNVEAMCCSKSRNTRPRHSLVQRCTRFEISAPLIARQQLQDLPVIPLRLHISLFGTTFALHFVELTRAPKLAQTGSSSARLGTMTCGYAHLNTLMSPNTKFWIVATPTTKPPALEIRASRSSDRATHHWRKHEFGNGS